jgi:hypothetical protein
MSEPGGPNDEERKEGQGQPSEQPNQPTEQPPSGGEQPQGEQPGEEGQTVGGFRALLAKTEELIKRGFIIPSVWRSRSGKTRLLLRSPDNKRRVLCTADDEGCEDIIAVLPELLAKYGYSAGFDVNELLMEFRGQRVEKSRKGVATVATSDEGIVGESIGPSGKAVGMLAELRELLRRRFEFVKKYDDAMFRYMWVTTWLALAASGLPSDDVIAKARDDPSAIFDVASKIIADALGTYTKYRDELQKLREENEMLKMQVAYWQAKYEELLKATQPLNRIERIMQILIAARPDLSIEDIAQMLERFLGLVLAREVQEEIGG